MTSYNWLLDAVFFLLVLLVTRPLGAYMHNVFEGTPPFPRILGRVEKLAYRLCGVDPRVEQTWQAYATALLAFSAVGLLLTWAVQAIQQVLPLNAQGLPSVPQDLAFNTAASFVSNTNWQSYAPESTVSVFTNMTVLTWQNFVSAASGMGVALAVSRGLTRQDPQRITLGNFWVDLIRSTLHALRAAAAILRLRTGPGRSGRAPDTCVGA